MKASWGVKPEAHAHTRLTELIKRESELADRGVTCAIKDDSEGCCMACPVSQHADFFAQLQPLCQTGREQETVLTAIVAQRRG